VSHPSGNDRQLLRRVRRYRPRRAEDRHVSSYRMTFVWSQAPIQPVPEPAGDMITNSMAFRRALGHAAMARSGIARRTGEQTGMV
jgi:hypothetical protein